MLACWRSDRDEEDTRTDKEVYGQSPRQENNKKAKLFLIVKLLIVCV
jgi:hypothetical protein